MTTPSCCHIAQPALTVPVVAVAPTLRSRLGVWLDIFIRHAGSVAVDHTHMLPLDRISGRTGNYQPPSPRRSC